MRDLILGLLVLKLELAASRTERLVERKPATRSLSAGHFKINIPIWVDGLSGGALSEFLQRSGPNVQKMVGAGVGDNAVPNDGRVCRVVGAGPVGGDVDEEVLCVPGE